MEVREEGREIDVLQLVAWVSLSFVTQEQKCLLPRVSRLVDAYTEPLEVHGC
jgi:hypothetical protein